MKRSILLAAGVLLAVLLSSCGAGGTRGRPPTAAVDADWAHAVAQNMLTAYNTGDYQAFSRDWSWTMKVAIGEHAFQDYRAGTLPVTGPFQAITSMQPKSGRLDPSHVSYTVYARFQQQAGVPFALTFSRANTTVDGIQFNPRS